MTSFPCRKLSLVFFFIPPPCRCSRYPDSHTTTDLALGRACRCPRRQTATWSCPCSSCLPRGGSAKTMKKTSALKRSMPHAPFSFGQQFLFLSEAQQFSDMVGLSNTYMLGKGLLRRWLLPVRSGKLDFF